jgi:hypothetical protein
MRRPRLIELAAFNFSNSDDASTLQAPCDELGSISGATCLGACMHTHARTGDRSKSDRPVLARC